MKTYTAVKLGMSKTAALSCIYIGFGKPIFLHVPAWIIHVPDAISLIYKKVAHAFEDIISVRLNIFSIDDRRDIIEPFVRVFIIIGSDVK